MTRNKGTFNFAANFEVLTKAPIDARLVVDTKANLITPSIWQDGGGNVWLYKGIVVSVVSDPSSENNGLYFLTDETNYTDYNYWIKLNTNIPSYDPSGTSWATFQLNNGNNGVVLKDASGILQVVSFDSSTFSNLQAGHIDINSIKIDTLNGALYAQDGSVYAISGSKTLLGYEGHVIGNGVTSVFPIAHDISTLNQVVSVWDNMSNEMIYPDIMRGVSTNIVSFISPPQIGSDYTIIILGFS